MDEYVVKVVEENFEIVVFNGKFYNFLVLIILFVVFIVYFDIDVYKGLFVIFVVVLLFYML